MYVNRSAFAAALVSLFVVATSAHAGTVTDPALETEDIITRLASPTTMAFYGDGDFLVLEKLTGRVRNVVDGVLQAGSVLDLAVEGAGERGLLGVAVHPDYPGTPHVFLFYSPSSTGSDTVGVTPLAARIERYNFSGGSLSNPTLILTSAAPPGGQNHIGGVMTFGPDGKLYVIVGDAQQDAGLQNNPPLAVADDTSVILRMNANGSAPGDNPLSAQGLNLAKYYAYGIRNSFGIAFDPETDDLWQTENGPASYDELNRVEPGFNSGWNVWMGPDARDANSTADLTAITGGQYSDPEFSWQDVNAPTGLAFLSGSALGANYQDSLIVASFSDRQLIRFELNGARTGVVSPNAGLDDHVADPADDQSPLEFGSNFGGISDLKIGPDGLLYGVSFGSGNVFVVRPVGGVPGGTRDLALVKLKAPTRAKVSAKKPVVETKAKLQIQNRSPQDETIADLETLEALVDLDVEPLGECDTPSLELIPPKRFPIVLKPKKKLSLTYRVSFDCADTYSYEASLAHEAIDDLPDTHTPDDVCPRPPLPFGVDPNPDGKLKDKGCGAKISGSERGGPVETEVIQK